MQTIFCELGQLEILQLLRRSSFVRRDFGLVVKSQSTGELSLISPQKVLSNYAFSRNGRRPEWDWSISFTRRVRCLQKVISKRAIAVDALLTNFADSPPNDGPIESQINKFMSVCVRKVRFNRIIHFPGNARATRIAPTNNHRNVWVRWVSSLRTDQSHDTSPESGFKDAGRGNWLGGQAHWRKGICAEQLTKLPIWLTHPSVGTGATDKWQTALRSTWMLDRWHRHDHGRNHIATAPAIHRMKASPESTFYRPNMTRVETSNKASTKPRNVESSPSGRTGQRLGTTPGWSLGRWREPQRNSRTLAFVICSRWSRSATRPPKPGTHCEHGFETGYWYVPSKIVTKPTGRNQSQY